MSLRCAAGSGGLNAAQQRDSRLAGSFTPIWKKKLAMPDIPSEEEGNCGLFSSAAGWLAGHLAKGAVADFVIGLMTKALTGANDHVA
jgi:hypothetical protein